MVIYGCDTQIIDVEASFLYGNLEEEIYMECPPCMDKKDDEIPSKGQQVSVIAQENLKLAVLPFHHVWRCTFDWEVTGVHEGTVCLLVGQKRLKDDYKDPNMLPKVNKADMAAMVEAIKDYCRTHVSL